jgi:steroid delta-isomerase-like uncharacterized protein
MTHDPIAALIDRHTAAWNRRDAAALASDHTVGGVLLSPMFHRVEGRPQIRRTYSDLFVAFPDWQIVYDPPFVDDKRVAVFFAVVATHKGEFMGVPGSGRRCSFEGVSLFRLDPEYLIEEERRVYDFTGVLIRLGVLRVHEAR